MEYTPSAGRKPPEGGELGGGTALRGLLGPLLLCLAVVCLARLVAWQNARIAEMTAENRWLEQARGEIERFRGGWTYAHQVEAGMDRLRRSVAELLKSRTRPAISGGEFSQLFRQAIPATHRPPGTQVFAFRLNAMGVPETMSGPGLETAMGRMVGGLLAAALDPDAVPAARRASLDRQSTGLFGELITLDVVARLRRGKLTGARWRGGDSLMLWNAVETKRETLFWIALFPRNAVLTSRPVETALRKGVARGRGRLWPVLAPLLPENGAVRLRTASDAVPAWPLRRLRAAIAGCRSRNDLAPAGTIVRALPGLWAIRDIVASNLPFELWLVGPIPPEARREKIPPWEQALRAGLFGLMALLTARRVMNPAGSDMSLRVWFAGFVTLVGILPLGLVWLLASWWITMNVERRVGESERQAEERFMRLDLMSAREVDRFAGACSMALVDRPLLERLTRVPGGEAGQAAIEAEHRRLAAAGLPAEYMQVFRPGRDAFVSTLPGMNDRPNRGLFQLQTGMVVLFFRSSR